MHPNQILMESQITHPPFSNIMISSLILWQKDDIHKNNHSNNKKNIRNILFLLNEKEEEFLITECWNSHTLRIPRISFGRNKSSRNMAGAPSKIVRMNLMLKRRLYLCHKFIDLN